MFRRYELRFICEDSRVIHGPIVSKHGYERLKELVDQIDDFTCLKFQLGKFSVAIPKETLSHGHCEIVPVGFLHTVIRNWRCR